MTTWPIFSPLGLAGFLTGDNNYHRKMVETAGNLIEQMFPKSIHAVTPQGFELKVALFVVAYSLNCYINL